MVGPPTPTGRGEKNSMIYVKITSEQVPETEEKLRLCKERMRQLMAQVQNLERAIKREKQLQAELEWSLSHIDEQVA